MADGVSAAAADTMIDALNAGYTWLQLHTGAPGAAGSANVAGNNVRKQITWNSAAGGSAAAAADLLWTNVSTSEAYTHASLWSASTAGNFGASGAITGGTVTAGDDFKLPAASITGSLPLAS